MDRKWQPGQRVLVAFFEEGIQSQAQIVYCQRLQGTKFAVGLELSFRWRCRLDLGRKALQTQETSHLGVLALAGSTEKNGTRRSSKAVDTFLGLLEGPLYQGKRHQRGGQGSNKAWCRIKVS